MKGGAHYLDVASRFQFTHASDAQALAAGDMDNRCDAHG